MKILLDTCTFLWLASDDPRLSPKARQLFANPENEVFLSSASAWEIATKHSAGRLPLPKPPGSYIPEQRKAHRIAPLPLDEESALHAARLPRLHNDPFDRMLVSQAIIHGLTLLTPDEQISDYPVRVMW